MRRFGDQGSLVDKRSMLNLGCGTRFHRDWTNVDLTPAAPGILSHDLLRPLPFSDDTFDVVYHSHVLEHLRREDGLKFLRECYRVCRRGGIIRVVVPDLEVIANLYLRFLNEAFEGKTGAQSRYDWIMLELYDQILRSESGGEMRAYLRNASGDLDEFLVNRLGNSLYSMLSPMADHDVRRKGRILRLLKNPRRSGLRFRRLITRIFAFSLWGRGGFEIANEIFVRKEGEVHRWMYDRYSLSRALAGAGFSEPTICAADKSRIEGWASFGLDTEPDGTTYKPDSLFCEAIK